MVLYSLSSGSSFEKSKIIVLYSSGTGTGINRGGTVGLVLKSGTKVLHMYMHITQGIILS